MASFVARAASSAAELAKDIKRSHDIGCDGGDVLSLIVEPLGLWTASSITLLCCIAACSVLHFIVVFPWYLLPFVISFTVIC